MTEYKLQRQHWEKAKGDNINLILQCKMQIEMAERILAMVEEKIAAFPKPKVEPQIELVKAKAKPL